MSEKMSQPPPPSSKKAIVRFGEWARQLDCLHQRQCILHIAYEPVTATLSRISLYYHSRLDGFARCES